MYKIYLATFLAAAISFTACNKKAGSASSSSSSSNDAVQQSLQKLAGSNAKDCGRLKSQDPGPYKTAGDCAMQAAQAKQPFYVAYEMPGLVVGVAGNSEGKLFSVQGQQAQGQAENSAAVSESPCPSELRLAQSGRVTCLTPGAMGGMPSGGSPHGGMTMPPATGENPHGGAGMPPSTTPNPHGSNPPAPSHKTM